MKKRVPSAESKERVRQALRYSQLVMKKERVGLTNDELGELASLLQTLGMSHEDVLKKVRSGLT